MTHTIVEIDSAKRRIASRQEWQAPREEILTKEKDLTRAHGRLAAERRRASWMTATIEDL